PHVVDDASARRLDDVGGVALQGMAEGVVGGQEEPVLAAGIHNGGTRAASERRGVVGVMHGVGRALRVGEVGSGCPYRDEGLLLLGGYARHGQCGTRVRAADQYVDLLGVEPFTRACRRDVGLVLMVSDQKFDLLAVDLAT